MSIRIMESARESMLERQLIVKNAIQEAEISLGRARSELEEISVGIAEIENAIERTRNPKKKKARKTTRSYARRDPTPGSQTHKVWETVNNHDGQISTGVLVSKTHLPVAAVKSAAANLVERGLIERISDGIFKAKQVVSTNGDRAAAQV